MAILKIQAEFEGPADMLFRAMTELMRAINTESFSNLEVLSPLNLQIMVVGQEPVTADDVAREELLKLNVHDLGLSQRTQNILLRRDLETVGQIVAKRPQELRQIPNFGAGSLAELEAALEMRGLSLST